MKKSTLDGALPTFVGSDESTKQVQEKFVRYFLDAPGKVLELGCGNGTMLSLLQQQGIEAYGIDGSPTSIKRCKEKGLTVYKEDLLKHLKKLKDRSIGGIFCAHVIEHMEPAIVIEVLKQSHRVLKENGIIIFITPNAKDLRINERFWLDVTHVRLYPKKLLVDLLQQSGFQSVHGFHDKEPAKNIGVYILKKLVYLWFLGNMFVGDLVVMGKR